MADYQTLTHTFGPLCDQDSMILILGSFPSAKSREASFFYGHPQNRFWPLMTALFREEKVPKTIDEKADLLRRNHIALWDSIHECDIIGSSDSSIKNAVPNDISLILEAADIRRIVTNGKKSHEIYMKYCYPETGREDICLPSTSPANASFSLDALIKAWGEVCL